MTPKEKAEELVIKMYQPLPTSKEAEKGKEHLYYNQYNAAKHCALIAVDEIIKDLKESLKVAEDLHLHARGLIIGSLVDWQEVKQEIENM